jgi:ketosteroid isomerase-like protein
VGSFSREPREMQLLDRFRHSSDRWQQSYCSIKRTKDMSLRKEEWMTGTIRKVQPFGQSCRPLFVAAIGATIVFSVMAKPDLAVAQDDDRAADHAALVALREQFTQALNRRDFAAMQPLVIDSVTFTSISNEKVSGLDGLKSYWEKLFEGDGSVLKSITVSPVADGLTEFFGDSVGVAQGLSHDVLEFRKVGRRELESRWTAVVVKVEGVWKVACIHMSANVLDNPVVKANALVGNLKMGAGALVGLLIGAIIFRRRRTA